MRGRTAAVRQHSYVRCGGDTTIGAESIRRDRQIQVTAAQDWYQITTFDNLGRTTQVDQHAQLGGNLIRRNKTVFDDRSRVYQSIRYAFERQCRQFTGR